MIELAWLIPLLPFAAFGLISFLFKKNKKLSAYIAITAMLIAMIISLGILIQVINNPASTENSITWMKMPGLEINMGVLIDPLAAVMLTVVTIVTTLVQIYSMGYMENDPGYSRFFAYLSLFAASMLGLVIANNYFQIFFFWELVGLCSYLLIGFWYERPSAADAGNKAFITNRVADFGFLLGILFLFGQFGTFNFKEIATGIETLHNQDFLMLTAFLMFLGPMGKSAQFPLHVWLPDAMEGPTPVSALIHAATMVAAGVYLLARCFILFQSSVVVMTVIAYVGGFTAIFAATIAVVQNGIKRILAFSTLSQLGYMVMAMGLGSVTASMFHLTTHAFFKALLFLGAGSVIHALHEEQNIWKMGGLYKKMKATTVTFIVAALALSGIPPLAGFWSKDEILNIALHENFTLYLIGAIAAFLTSFYMFRLIFVAFFGKENPELNPHESPASMTVPMGILAVFSVFIGFIGAPFIEKGFGYYVNAGHHHVAEGINWNLMLSSSGIAVAGIIAAWLIYRKRIIDPETLAEKFWPIHNLVSNKYYIDEIYRWLIDNIWDGIATVCRWIDLKIIDGISDGIASLTKYSGGKLRFIHTGRLQTYALVFFVAVAAMILYLAYSEPAAIAALLGGGI